jgi:hypothetical protein
MIFKLKLDVDYEKDFRVLWNSEQKNHDQPINNQLLKKECASVR